MGVDHTPRFHPTRCLLGATWSPGFFGDRDSERFKSGSIFIRTGGVPEIAANHRLVGFLAPDLGDEKLEASANGIGSACRRAGLNKSIDIGEQIIAKTHGDLCCVHTVEHTAKHDQGV